MDIASMHVWFRQYAQQMGLQNVRAILPEQIDLLINTSISDTINQVITQNIGMTSDRVITDNSKLGQINALRSLYKVQLVKATPIIAPVSGQPFSVGTETQVLRLYADIGTFTTSKFDYLYLVDLSINYKSDSPDGGTTNYFPVRLIDDVYLADTLNDFILKPRLRSPIAVVYNDTMDIYIDEYDKNPFGAIHLFNNLQPNTLRVGYIAKPAKVKYAADLIAENVDCDLPEHMHVDILKHAVDLYRMAVTGSLSGAQQQAQNQQRENARNNVNPYASNPQQQ